MICVWVEILPQFQSLWNFAQWKQFCLLFEEKLIRVSTTRMNTVRNFRNMRESFTCIPKDLSIKEHWNIFLTAERHSEMRIKFRYIKGTLEKIRKHIQKKDMSLRKEEIYVHKYMYVNSCPVITQKTRRRWLEGKSNLSGKEDREAWIIIKLWNEGNTWRKTEFLWGNLWSCQDLVVKVWWTSSLFL